MAAISLTIHLPDDVWRAVKSLAPHEGDATVVILRALEEYVSATAKRRGHRSGKYQQLVKALSTPVADLQLSARPATALHVVNIRYVYELVTLEPRALRGRKNFGEKSFREVKDKLAMQGLTLGMTLEDDAYRAAVVAAVAAHIKAGKG